MIGVYPMQPVAFLTSSNMLPGSPNARADIFEFDLEFGALSRPCAQRSIQLQPVVWDDPNVDWSAFAAVVIGTTWDYWDKKNVFAKKLEAIEDLDIPVFNSSSVVRWNMDKIYLKALHEAGVPIAPTLWRDNAAVETLEAAAEELGADTIVAKPRVGAAAMRLIKWTRGDGAPDPARAPGGPCLIQPFLPDIAAKGEITVMTYNGNWSHAVRKVPAQGDFRVQSVYGAQELDYQPTEDELGVVGATLESVADILDGERLLYARIDIAPGLDGAPILMEAELIEPYHYPEFAPQCGEYFAAALDQFMSETV